MIFTLSGYAQKLTGIVYELDEKNEKIPLVGTNVYWEGTQIGTTTNEYGIFKLDKIKSDHLHLVVSYIGYKAEELEIPDDQDSIVIVLSVNRELKEIVVVGTSLSKFIDDLDAKQTEVITSKELLKAACCNLAESFTTNASVDIQFQDAVTGAKQIQLLGLSGLYTQMLFENIPTLKGLGSTFGLGYVPGPWMTSISVSKGAASVVNGYESITGQINLEYKKPDDVERYYFNAFQSSHYKTDLNANIATHLNDNLSTMLLAHADFNTKSMDDNHDLFRDQPNVKQFNIINRWAYQSFNGFESQFGIQILNEERRGGQLPDLQSNSVGNVTQPYKINIDTKRYEVFAKSGYVFDDEAYTSVGLILGAQWHNQKSVLGLRNYNGDQKTFYANLLFQTKTEDENHAITFGGSYAFDKYDETFEGIDYNRNESRPGIFSEYTYSPSNVISIVPGVRLDFHNLYGTFFTPRLHVKYNLDENTIVRTSAGKGYRSVNVFAENLNYIASSRNFVVVDQPTYEEAWNYGLNITRFISVNDRELRVTAEYYRTDFLKQTVVDVDSDVRQVNFYDLKGNSYSNNYQIEMAYQPINRLDLSAAFRITDVRSDYDGVNLIKPLASKYKALLTFSYSTEESGWLFDSSILLNGGGRIPSTEMNPSEHQRKLNFPAYPMINAQITKRIDVLDVYLGVENLTNYKQENPIIDAEDPFGNYFDGSMIWGPIDGTKVYLGIRLSVM